MTRSPIPTAARNLAVFVVYTALTAALAWPLLDDLGGRLAGSSSDVYMNQWVDWWTKKALSEGLDLYHTNYIFYPTGTSLVFHSFSYPNSAISLLLAPVIGQIAAYNVMILLAYPLSAIAMYLLAKELTGCSAAAFVAGLVYAFQPYHIFESAHPVIVSTQWMPLFILSLTRMLDARGKRWLSHVLLAALWFVLTALSSWHLMVMLACLAILYLAYDRLVARRAWPPRALARLALLGAITAVVLIPFLYPMVLEQLAGDAAYMAVSAEDGIGNDLMSLFIPNHRHPLSWLVPGLHDQIGFSTRRPGYLGYAALGLALLGALGSRRGTRFWWLSGGLFLIASLGLRVEWGGAPLHSFDLPWARPIVALLRNPFRLNVLVFFSLGLLAAFGVRRLSNALSGRGTAVKGGLLAALGVLILAEYLVIPFPTTEPLNSPFVRYLAQQGTENLAVADFPMGRQPAKYYMYLQTMHGQPILDGHVSRTPYDAYAFVESDSLLAALREGAPPPADLNIDERLAALLAERIQYVVLHRQLPSAGETDSWREWIDLLPTPAYADEWLLAYTTDPAGRGESSGHPTIPHRVAFGDGISMLGYSLQDGPKEPGAVLSVTLYWECRKELSEDLHVFVQILGDDGRLAAQHDGVPGYGTRPVSSWAVGDVVRDNHLVFTEPGLPAGEYVLSVGIYDYATMARLPAVDTDGGRFARDMVILQPVDLERP